MNTESNLEYHLQDETLDYHIDNIVSYKKFLENILLEIKSKNYNKNMIKLLSRHIEKSLSEISNDTTLFEYNKAENDIFIPSVRVVSVDSDTSDNESDMSENEKTKIELYSPFVSSTRAYKNIYDDEPDFLDDALSLPESVYKTYSQPKNIHFSTDCVKPYKNFEDSTQLTRNSLVNTMTIFEDCKQPPNISKFKDKLANEFLNNNLELNNYHYLKSFNLDKINNYCNLFNVF